MSIDLNNYEAWFLDYAEGNLTPSQLEVLEQFLSEHPDLREELEFFESIELDAADDISFPNKAELKCLPVVVTTDNCETFFIGYIEQQLTSTQESAMQAFLRSKPQWRAVFEAYQRTILKPTTHRFVPKAALYAGIEDTFILPTGKKLSTAMIESVEGIIAPEDATALEELLKENTALQHAFAAYKQTVLKPEHIAFGPKSTLYRSVEEALYLANGTLVADAMIASVEGVASPEESKLLEGMLASNPELQKAFAAYQATVLEAPTVFFPNKASLKQKAAGRIVPMWRMGFAAAAAVVVLLTFWFYDGGNDPSGATPLNGVATQELPDVSLPMHNFTWPSNESVLPNDSSNSALPFYETVEGPNGTLAVELPQSKRNNSSDTATPSITPLFVPEPSEEGIALQPEELPLQDTSAATPQLPLQNIENTVSNQEAIAANTEPSTTDGEYLSPLKLAGNTIKDKLFDGKDKIKAMDVAQAIVPKDSEQFALTDASTNERTNYSLQIGGFSFSRSKKKVSN